MVSGFGLSAQSPPAQVLQTYQDTQQIPKWAPGQVAAATEAGLVVNHPDQKLLNPNQSATRAEVSAFIYQALVKAEQAERISSNYIFQPQKIQHLTGKRYFFQSKTRAILRTNLQNLGSETNVKTLRLLL